MLAILRRYSCMGGLNNMVTKTSAIALGVGGVIAGTLMGWGIVQFTGVPQSNAAPVSTAPQRWMLTYNGAVVIGQKFPTELECEKGRRQYVEGIFAQEEARFKMTWGKTGYTMAEYPYFQADMAKRQAATKEAEATYCSPFPV